MALDGFTPIQAVLGGLLIGVASATLLIAHGKIFGVSGLYTMFLSGEDKAKGVESGSVLAGLVLGSIVCFAGYRDFSFPSETVDFPAWRYTVAAFFVGWGVQLGNGCTSGHGISGLARFSRRSIVAVGTFMTTAIVTASVSDVLKAAGRPTYGLASIAIPTAKESILPVAATIVLPLVLLMMERIGSKLVLCKYNMDDYKNTINMDRPCHTRRLIMEQTCEDGVTDVEQSASASTGNLDDIKTKLVLPCKEFACAHMAMIGFTFSVGLGVSGMTNQGKILNFLSIASGSWDPSLMLVMGSGLVPSLIANIYAKRLISSDRCPTMGLHFNVPTRTDVDFRLVGGAALFGFGWAFVGWCPGPAIANLLPASVGGSQMAALFVVWLAFGIWFGKLVDQVRANAKDEKQGTFLNWSQRARVELCDVCG